MIILNGKKYFIWEKISLEDLIKRLKKDWDIDLESAIVLVNNMVVKKDNWDKEKIRENSHIEILSFVSGG